MHIEIALVALFAVATAVALVARRFKLPYTVALVIAGLALGTARAFEPPRLTKELLYAVFLPGLLFEAAYALEFRRFWQNKLAVFSLAMPGLVAAIAMTAGVLVPAVNGLHFVDHYTLGEGLVFASLIAATDPIAVVALFKSFGTPKRLAVLVEGESLLNDGTAVVVFSMSLSLAVLDFARVVGMGVLIGAAVGYAVSMVIHKVDDPMIEITLTTIGAYGSFVAAEFFHYSGVIAVVTSGMLCGNYAARTGMSASTRVAVSSFWEYLAFALNSLVFLLIGFEVKVEKILEAWKPILIAYVSVLLVRAIVIHVVGFLLRRTREAFPLAWANVLTWGGLRGSLSMVLVLALPQEFPHRDLVVAMTFGVVILSILVQGLTMGPLLRRLKLVGISEGRAEYDRLKGALSAVNAGLVEVEKMEVERGIPKVVTDEVRAQYARRADEYEAAVAALHLKAERLLEEDRLRATRRALIAEKDALVTAYKSGQIAEESYEHLVADVDARIFELEAGEGDVF
jgi:monovalent cation:H+ antiporter, CPA1 family